MSIVFLVVHTLVRYSRESEKNWRAGRVGPRGRQFFFYTFLGRRPVFLPRSRSPWALPGNRSSFFLPVPLGGSSFYSPFLWRHSASFFTVPFPGRPPGHRHVQFGTPFLTESFIFASFHDGLASEGSRNRGPAGRPGPRPKEREKKTGPGAAKGTRKKNWAAPLACPDPAKFFYPFPSFHFPFPGRRPQACPDPSCFFSSRSRPQFFFAFL